MARTEPRFHALSHIPHRIRNRSQYGAEAAYYCEHNQPESKVWSTGEIEGGCKCRYAEINHFRRSEEYFSRLRRVAIGIHHHIAGAYLLRYPYESSWREDNAACRMAMSGEHITALTLKRGKRVDFMGYWERRDQ